MKKGRFVLLGRSGKERFIQLICLISSSLLLTSLLFVTSPSAAPAKVFEWKFQQHLAPSDPSMGCHANLMEMIEKNTNGRIKIKIYATDSITPSSQLFTGVNTGVVDMAATDSGWWAGTMPAGAAPSGSMPFAYQETQGISQILWDYGLEQVVRDEYAKHGIYLLADYPISYSGYGISMNKPVKSLADLKGKKIRGFGLFVKWLQKLGASAVSLPFAEIYTALSTGTIDGVCTAWSPTLVLKYYEVAKYGILPSANGQGCQDIVLSMKAWNSLPDDLKMILQLTAHNWANWVARYYAPNQGDMIAGLKKAGMTFTTFSEADQAKMLEAAMSCWDESAGNDPGAKKAVQILKDYYKKYPPK